MGVSIVVDSLTAEVAGDSMIAATGSGVGACCSEDGLVDAARFFSTATLFTLMAVLVNIFLSDRMTMMHAAIIIRRRFIARLSMRAVLFYTL